jgi:hypothetical protein
MTDDYVEEGPTVEEYDAARRAWLDDQVAARLGPPPEPDVATVPEADDALARLRELGVAPAAMAQAQRDPGFADDLLAALSGELQPSAPVDQEPTAADALTMLAPAEPEADINPAEIPIRLGADGAPILYPAELDALTEASEFERQAFQTRWRIASGTEPSLAESARAHLAGERLELPEVDLPGWDDMDRASQARSIERALHRRLQAARDRRE